MHGISHNNSQLASLASTHSVIELEEKGYCVLGKAEGRFVWTESLLPNMPPQCIIVPDSGNF